jgi:hypothetical protein
MLLLGIAFITVIFMPEKAFAFGPVTHFELGWNIIGVLKEIPNLLSVPLSGLFTEFLLGNVVPDIVLAKNLAKLSRHSHNWHNGFTLLNSALNDRERAVALGYLGHLAADVVAHNLYVPAISLNKYYVRGHGHVYWEIKMDKLLLQHPDEYRMLFKKETFHRYDYFLDRIITGTIVRGRMNNKLSRRVFNIAGNLAVTKQNRRSLKSELQPSVDIVTLCRDLAFRSMLSVMKDLENSPVTRLDPRGKITAEFTKNTIRKIRQELPHKSGPLPIFDWKTDKIVQELIKGISQVIPAYE